MTLLAVVSSFLAGLIVGAVHYGGLWWNVRLFAAGGSVLKALAVQVVRLALIAAALIALVSFGAMPLLVATLGVISARIVAVRWLGALQ
jgi:F1F0 ATPase subunit 2